VSEAKIDDVLLRGMVMIRSFRLVFFSTIARPAKIFRMLADGSGRTIIVANELGTPYHLTCDYQMKRLYWTDGALSRIQYADYAGRNIQSLRGRSISHPFGIAIFGGEHQQRDTRVSEL
jgi:hypothetical protein